MIDLKLIFDGQKADVTLDNAKMTKADLTAVRVALRNLAKGSDFSRKINIKVSGRNVTLSGEGEKIPNKEIEQFKAILLELSDQATLAYVDFIPESEPKKKKKKRKRFKKW